MKFVLFISILILSITSCIISEQKENNGTYKGNDDLFLVTNNDIVKEFAVNTPYGKLSLSGFWDIIDNEFYIETFNNNQLILIFGQFDSDSTVFGNWQIDDDKGDWEGVKLNISDTSTFSLD